ncbi:MAG TPA: hypothetical protein VNV66_18050 [Pilimelia sp.]|nr:hypothetical protein [Pilimelia sp.]
MPAARIRHATAAGFLVASLLAAAGCGSLAQARQGIGRTDLVNDLAARLQSASELTYSAEYRLPGSHAAAINQRQDPPRAAYAYPGGRLTLTPEATTECRHDADGTSCVLTPPPAPGATPAAALFATPGRHGLVPPAVVAGLLSAAALDADTVIDQQYDTTVAGLHATCLEISQVRNAPSPSFDVCVTTRGVLGSFAGTVNGAAVEFTLTRYHDDAEPGAFRPPPGARLVDRRPARATARPR